MSVHKNINGVIWEYLPPFVVSYLPPLRKILGKSQLSNHILLFLSALIVLLAYRFSVNTEWMLEKLTEVLSFCFQNSAGNFAEFLFGFDDQF